MVADFPVKHRATGGVIANSLNAETGDVAAIRLVGREDEEMMLITEDGTILRTEVEQRQPLPARVARRDGHEAGDGGPDRVDHRLRRRSASGAEWTSRETEGRATTRSG